MAHVRYAERYEGVFANLDTPPYKYEEYPKWIATTEGPRIVKDRREELEWLAFTPAKIPTDSDVKELGQALDDVKSQLDSKNAEVEALQKQLAEALAKSVEATTAAKTAGAAQIIAQAATKAPAQVKG